MRSFLGIDLSRELKEKIFTSVSNSRIINCADLRFVKKENYHITMKFLGQQDENIVEKLDFITDIKNEYIPKDKVFKINDWGVFPNWKKQKIFYISVEDEENMLLDLAVKLETELFERKIIKEIEKKFVSHITVARNRGHKNVIEKDDILDIKEELIINNITLFRSTLTSTGPKYDVLREY